MFYINIIYDYTGCLYVLTMPAFVDLQWFRSGNILRVGGESDRASARGIHAISDGDYNRITCPP